MNNLFICLTPLQALIAQQLIRQTAPTPADLLMACYVETDNDKFRHYYRETAKMCDYAEFVCIPQNKWPRRIHILSLLKNFKKQYHTIYAASIDNPIVQYPVSHLRFNKLETFDDGVGNLYPNSILYCNQYYNFKNRIIRHLQGINHTTETLRQLSSCHHTLYPTQNNIASPTVALKLWQNNAFLAENPVSGSLKTHTILLGQPLFEQNNDNIALFHAIIDQIKPDHYFPHPRETYRLNTEYIHSPLIFEDYLLQHIQQHPDTEYHIYHIASTAALNVAAFERTRVFALRPKHDFFQQKTFQYLYDLMEKMQIPVQPL